MNFDQIRELRALLVECRCVERQLEIVVTRQTKSAPMGEGIGKSTEQPLFFSERASDAWFDLRRVLLKYALPARQCFCKTPYAPCTWESFPKTMPDVILWMITRIMRFRYEDSMLADLRVSYNQAMEAIDSPPTRIYLGDCSCETKLYGDPEADELACPGCKLVYDPAVLRDLHRFKGREMLVTAADAARYVGAVWGVQLKRDTIYKWGRRGKLSLIEGENGQRLWKLGEIIDLATEIGKSRPDKCVR